MASKSNIARRFPMPDKRDRAFTVQLARLTTRTCPPHMCTIVTSLCASMKFGTISLPQTKSVSAIVIKTDIQLLKKRRTKIVATVVRHQRMRNAWRH